MEAGCLVLNKLVDNFWSTIKRMKGTDKVIASVVDGYATKGENTRGVLDRDFLRPKILIHMKITKLPEV